MGSHHNHSFGCKIRQVRIGGSNRKKGIHPHGNGRYAQCEMALLLELSGVMARALQRPGAQGVLKNDVGGGTVLAWSGTMGEVPAYRWAGILPHLALLSEEDSH